MREAELLLVLGGVEFVLAAGLGAGEEEAVEHFEDEGVGGGAEFFYFGLGEGLRHFNR